MQGWTWVVGLFIGAAIGSFLNVVIYRMPRGISLSNPPRSFCPKCKHELGFFDLFPLLSWLLLGGKCRYCKATVSPRYFIVELITGSIWAGIWYQYLIAGSDPAMALAYAAAASALVAVIFIDIEFYIIPDQVNAFLLFAGLLYNGWLFIVHDSRAVTWGMPSAVAGGLVGVLALWLIAFLGRVAFKKDAMGHGDIKMARGIGALLFPGLATMSFGMAVVLGAVLGIAQVMIFKPGGKVVQGAGAEQADVVPSEEDAAPPPEPLGSLLKAGVGYVACIDVLGLFVPKLYMSWFGEDPFTPVQEMEEFEVEPTMIPFGPYLALGAIVATIFQSPLLGGWNAYIKWVQGGHAVLEHIQLTAGLF